MHWMVGAVAIVLVANEAIAQTGGMAVDASSGGWVAFHHSEDDIHTDLCGAAAHGAALLFRAGPEGLEVRTVDEKWNLPPDTTGDMTLKVGSLVTTLHTTVYDPNALTAEVKAEDLGEVMDAMDKASSATIVFGAKTSKVVSLAGSTVALNAFRACVNRAGFAVFSGSSGKTATPF